MGLSRSTKPVAPSELGTRVRRFYAYQTASSFAIWIPVWALWIRGHLSSDFDVTLVDVAFWIGLLVFQLPVGVVADRTPRRRTINPERVVPLRGHPRLRPQRDVLGIRRRKCRVVARRGVLDRDLRVPVRGLARAGAPDRTSAVHMAGSGC